MKIFRIFVSLAVIAGLAADLGSVLCAIVMWSSALVLFAGAILVIRYLNKKNA